jgi:hypothetical protein
MESSQKTAAAMSAVMAYIQQQEAAQARAPIPVPPEIYHGMFALYRQLKDFFEGPAAG